MLASVLWLPVAWLEWRSLVFFFDRLPGAAHPVPVHVATRLKPHAPLARVPIGAWWLIHAAAIVAVAEAFVYYLKPFNPDAVERVLYLVIPLGILFGTAFAMNTHLLIAVYALTRSERAVRWMYHFRIVLDLPWCSRCPRSGSSSPAAVDRMLRHPAPSADRTMPNETRRFLP